MKGRTETSEAVEHGSWIRSENPSSSFPSTDEESRKARRVARALHSKYEHEVQRWRSYEALFAFLSFAALLLTVLYLQSDARNAFQVHEAIRSVVPGTATMASRDAILEWIRKTLTALWVDPPCGDGVCSAPFEFASYGRFGCRADCGKLPEIQQLTTLQIDLYYNFRHPANSIPSAELMTQASWNLCPTDGAPHGMDCYFDEVQRFAALEGEVHVVLDDVPDGKWELHLKRDFFDKVRGAVRITDLLKEQATWSRKYGAYLAATADQGFEIGTLEEAIEVGELSAYNYTLRQLEANYTAALSQYASDLEDGTVTQIEFESETQVLSDERDFTEVQLERTLCLCDGNSFEAPCPTTDAVTFEAETDDDDNPMTDDEVCEKYEALAVAAVVDRLAEVRFVLSVKRLGGSDGYNGKIGARADKKAEQRSYVNAHTPELHDWMFVNPVGATPESDLSLNETKYDTLAKYLSDGPTGYLDPTTLLAQQSLTQSLIAETELTELVARAYDRVEEIRRQEAEVAAHPAVEELLHQAAMSPIAELLESELLPKFIDYDHVTWEGGDEAYLTCSLETRAPEYVGHCVDVITCARDNNTAPYECPDETDLPATECATRCSFQEDCAALCACQETCNDDAGCSCEACEILQDALETAEYHSLQELAQTASPLSSRRLLQEPSDDSVGEQLSDLAESVDALGIGQEDLKAQVTSLEQEVELANELAQRREEDNSLQDLINQGRDQIAAGQENVESMLSEIIGMQNETLEAVQEAADTVKALEEMTTKSLEAQSAIQVELREQMNAIRIAYQQSLISLDEAAELWKLARRDRLVSEKDAYLSTYRCSPETVVVHLFEVDNYEETENLHGRERYVGLNNRIVAGLLLHTQRSTPTRCPESRFTDIEDDCRRAENTSPYGVDPVFKSGTTLYDPDLDNVDSMVHFYNCTALQSPTYNRLDPYTSTESFVNRAPFCMELFNMRDIPYGFRAFALDGKPVGFPVLFDINLSEYEAEKWYRYVAEGLFLDGNTESVAAEMVVYNAELDAFGYLQVVFDSTDGGTIQVATRIITARADLYQTSLDFFRLTLELLLTAIVAGWCFETVWTSVRACRQGVRSLQRYASLWTWIDLTSNLLLLVSVLMWWSHVLVHARPFDIDLSYDVYASLNPPAAYLRLSQDGDGLRAVNRGFNKMQRLVESLSWYYAVNGLSILLLIVRLLKKMDFQPRLGVVTRSIALAGPDLAHFTVVSGLVFFGYAMMAHLIFGSSILPFSSFGRAVNTCFEILLGDVSVSAELKELSGLQRFAGTLFFWSFELLVFLVLLNFLLAIIVDAFSVVKENTAETTGMHTEIFAMFRHKWRNAVGWISNKNFVPYDRLNEMLRRYGSQRFDESDSSDAPKIKRSIKEEIDAATVKGVLSRCLEDSRFDSLLRRRPSLFGSWKDSDLPLPTERELDDIVLDVMQKFSDEQDAASDDDGPTQQHRLLELMQRWEGELHQAQQSLATSLEELAATQREILQRGAHGLDTAPRL